MICVVLFLVLFCRSKDYLIGINYFAGWWRLKPNKWFQPWNQSVDWRPIYPNRIPLLGDYNDQRTMDKEIAAASSYGIDFFQILYYDDLPKEREPHAHYLNRGISNFINSTNAHLMKFYISWCNTGNFLQHNLSEFEEFVWRDWVPAFRHPSYLRIDNKLVIKLISSGEMYQTCNGSSSCIEEYFNTLKDIVKKAVPDAPDMLIGGGIGAGYPVKSKTLNGYDYDWTGTYMDVPVDGFVPFQVYPWKNMSDWTNTQRAVHVTDKIMYLPYMGVGWDPRPWREKRPSFEFPTWQEWVDDLFQMKKDLDSNPNFGIPIESTKSRQKMFSIYAWNEFGEGGFVAPSKGFGYGRLQAIKNVFGR